MTSLAIRLQELGDAELEEFIETWVETKSRDYAGVERLGGANDKGRDVIGFVTASRHEGEWDLYQCKRKTRGGKLGLPEALTELGKVFHHYVEGAYATLPRSYVFVAPRGIVGPCRDLLLNPSRIAPSLIDRWNANCAKAITAKKEVPLSLAIRSAIESYDFTRVSYLTAPSIVKSPAAGPALTRVLGTVPGEAPPGIMPDAIQDEELPYVGQLAEVYSEVGRQASRDRRRSADRRRIWRTPEIAAYAVFRSCFLQALPQGQHGRRRLACVYRGRASRGDRHVPPVPHNPPAPPRCRHG